MPKLSKKKFFSFLFKKIFPSRCLIVYLAGPGAYSSPECLFLCHEDLEYPSQLMIGSLCNLNNDWLVVLMRAVGEGAGGRWPLVVASVERSDRRDAKKASDSSRNRKIIHRWRVRRPTSGPIAIKDLCLSLSRIHTLSLFPLMVYLYLSFCPCLGLAVCLCLSLPFLLSRGLSFVVSTSLFLSLSLSFPHTSSYVSFFMWMWAMQKRILSFFR